MLRLVPFVFLGCIIACSGGASSSGSGVEPTKKLVELTAPERQNVCDYMVMAEGGVGKTKMCGDGLTITVKSAADCTSSLSALSASCTATVDNAETCAEAAGEDLCNLFSSPKCSFLLQCH